MLTDEEKDDYVKSGYGGCPYCHTGLITGGSIEVDGRVTWQEVTCDECHAEWEDVYTLSEIREVEPPTDKVPDEPDEGDWVTTDHLTFHECCGRGVIVVPTVDGEPTDWKAAVKARMEADQFWPNVWSLSDHGNYCLLSLED